jgi:hypothetical protein
VKAAERRFGSSPSEHGRATDDGMRRNRTGGGGSGVPRKETMPEVGQVGRIGRMGRTPDGSISEKKSEQGKVNWWAGKDSRAEIKGGLQKIPFQIFNQGFEFK